MMSVANNQIQGVKIARVSTVAFFVETQLHAQVSALVQAGAQVTIVASENALVSEIPGSHYVSIEIPRKINLLRDLVALIKLWLFFRRSSFDIVHSTTPKAGLLCCLAAKFARVPIRLHTYTGQPWIGLTGIKRFLSKGSDKLIALLNTHCYADSLSQKDFLVDSGVSHSEGISVLGAGSLAGIDLERFDPARFNKDDKNKFKAELDIPITSQILLFVGRLSRDKGIIELLEAYQKVISKGVDAVLILLGPPEADIDSLLARLPETVRERVITPGFSTKPEQFMSIADILLLPSYREGFGTVVIEAAAMGVPTIGADIYGLSDAILHEETGLLVPVKDVNKLAEAIYLLLHDSALRCALGLNARKRVKKEFSSNRMNKLLLNEYIRLLAAN